MYDPNHLENELNALNARNLLRRMRTVEGSQGPLVRMAGREYICFCSNNYLGMADRAELKQAAIEAIQKYGTGAGASRLVSGNMRVHMELEERLAEFEQTEAALAFPSGYMANTGVVSALAGKGDIVFADRLSHASIVDGCRLSKARLRVYPHGDTDALEAALKRSDGFEHRWIVTDSVFSMDGDLAPLEELVELARKYGAKVILDEAHGTGVLGERGSGLAEALCLEDQVDVRIGTLSKAAGCAGGFVAGSRVLIDYLLNRARSFIYTTAMPPANCAAAKAAIDLIERETILRKQLVQNTRFLKKCLNVSENPIETPIVPVLVGDTEKALALSDRLLEQGILAPAIRPPTVPRGTSRIRLSVMATHTEAQVRCAGQALVEAAARLGISTT